MDKHKDKGAQDLRLIDDRLGGIRVEMDKEIAHGIKIHGNADASEFPRSFGEV